jgi:hypothetical protein
MLNASTRESSTRSIDVRIIAIAGSPTMKNFWEVNPKKTMVSEEGWYLTLRPVQLK